MFNVLRSTFYIKRHQTVLFPSHWFGIGDGIFFYIKLFIIKNPRIWLWLPDRLTSGTIHPPRTSTGFYSMVNIKVPIFHTQTQILGITYTSAPQGNYFIYILIKTFIYLSNTGLTILALQIEFNGPPSIFTHKVIFTFMKYLYLLLSSTGEP